MDTGFSEYKALIIVCVFQLLEREEGRDAVCKDVVKTFLEVVFSELFGSLELMRDITSRYFPNSQTWPFGCSPVALCLFCTGKVLKMYLAKMSCSWKMELWMCSGMPAVTDKILKCH